MPGPRSLGAILFVACFVLYGNTVPNRYSIDDETVTRGHHATSRGLAALPEIFSTSHIDFAGQEFDYRPVTLATFALEHELFGENSHLGHFFNVLLYGVTAVVLFHFLRSVFGAGATLLAFTSALLFVVHPIHTEVVASLKSRDEILALLFGLLSALAFSRYFDRWRPYDAIVGLLALVLALMSKLSALPFAVLIPLSLAFKDPKKIRHAAVLAVLLVASVALYRGVILSFVPTFVPVPAYVENPLIVDSDWNMRIGTGLKSLLFYLGKLVVPYPLNFYYGYRTFETVGIASAAAVLSAVVCLGLIWYALRYARARDAAAFGIVWFFVAIAPYLNVLALVKGIVAERSAYLASVGFAIAIVYVIFRVAGIDEARRSGRERIAALGIALLVVVHGAMTWDRNRDWKDSFTLYEADIGRLQDSVMANQMYSRQLRREFGPTPDSDERKQKLEYAIALSQEALRILPTYAAAHEHIGAIYLYDLGNAAAALPHFARASELEPRYTLAHYDGLYGSVVLGQLDDALEFGQRLLREDPDHLMGLFYVSKLYFTKGDVEQAFVANARLARLAPDRDLAYLNYGYFYYERSDVPRAIANFEKALAIAPDNPAVRKDLVGILEDDGQLEKARRYAMQQDAGRGGGAPEDRERDGGYSTP